MNQTGKRSWRGIAAVMILSLCITMFGVADADAASRPARPSFKVTKRTKTTATLKIKKKGKVSGYQVYVSGSKKGKYRLIMGTKSRTVKLKKLKKTKTYYVKIRAFRTTGIRIRFGKFSSPKKIGKYRKVSAATKPDTKPTAKPTVKPTAKPADAAATAKKYAEEVLVLVNKERQAAGLDALTLDPALYKAASVRAKELLTQFSHTRPDGTDCFSLLKESGIAYQAAGENIAAGQPSPEAVVEGWMNSPGHRANILSANFHKLGVGYVNVNTGYGHYWVQLFTD